MFPFILMLLSEDFLRLNKRVLGLANRIESKLKLTFTNILKNMVTHGQR